MRTRGEGTATRAGKWLLALVVPASGLALGTIPTAVLVVMAAAAAVACGLLWWHPPDRAPRATRWAFVALGILFGMTVLQAVPLPAGLTAALAPASSDIWGRALSPLREAAPSWHSLSIAPGATRVEVLRGAFYACVFLGALRIALLEEGSAFLTRLIVFSACLMAVSTLAHSAVSAERVFGLYRPREAYGYRRVAPLLNVNHVAAYLDIGACVAASALISGRAMPRALSASAAAVLAATSVWEGSRGGVGALFLGLVATFGLSLYARKSFDSRRVETAILGACAVLAAVLIGLAVSNVAGERLQSQDLTKLHVARSSLALIGSSPWFGWGRGGFETVFPAVHPGTTYVTFTHPEDIVVQWLVEWGLPVTLAGFFFFAWALRPRTLLRAVRPAVGAWVAIVTAVLHDLVDFHLEVPGIVALVALCAAIVLCGRGSTKESSAPATTFNARTLALGFSVLTFGAIAWAVPEVGHSLAEDRRSLSAMAVDAAVPPEAFRDALRATMLRYPAEAFFPLMGAVRAQVVDGGSVVPWVARALERSPHFGRAHFVLARSLAPAHPAQARLEYRLAYENDEQLRFQIGQEAVRLVDGVDSALELVPDGPSGIGMLETLVASLGSRLPATAVALDRELARRAPESLSPVRHRVEAAVSDAANQSPWCEERRGCLLDGIDAAQAFVQREPDKCESHLMVARLRALQGDVDGALDALDKASEVVTDRASCQRQLINLALEKGKTRRADIALERVVRSGCGLASECVELYGWAGSLEESRGHFVRAVRIYRRLLDVAPERDDIRQHIGELGTKDGLLAEALEAYGSLASRYPNDPRWPAKIKELRAARVGGAPRVPGP